MENQPASDRQEGTMAPSVQNRLCEAKFWDLGKKGK